MPIGNRTLAAGTRLVANYRKARYACMVSAGEDSKTVYTLEDGRSFSSPSAAGSAVMNGAACNGWKFWSVGGESPTAETPAKTRRTTAPRASKKRPNGEHRAISVASSQDGVTEGCTRYFCDSCMKAFELTTDHGSPEACPAGHPATVVTEPTAD